MSIPIIVLAIAALLVFPRITVTACAFMVNPLLGIAVGLACLLHIFWQA